MARLVTREFKPSEPVYARRFFVAAGRHWNPGDRFEWTRLSVAQRRVKQLFDVGKLVHLDEMASTTEHTSDVVLDPADTPLAPDAPFTNGAASPAPVGLEPSNDLPEAPQDDLDDLDMKQLRAIAAEIGAPSRVSRAAQRQSIRETRAAAAAG